MNNTTRTVLGFLSSWFRRRLPFAGGSDTVDGIYNYLRIEGLFPTSGQPAERELEQICDEGYTTVVNLAPTSTLENSVVREAGILAARNVEYIHIPVDFQHPTIDDFDRFVAAVDKADPGHLWVHCAANMRVSAFVYRYRVAVLGHSVDVARTDLQRIWDPFGVWDAFVSEATPRARQENR